MVKKSKVEYEYDKVEQRHKLIWFYNYDKKPEYSGVYFEDKNLMDTLPNLVGWLNKCLKHIEEKKIPQRVEKEAARKP